MMPNLTWFKKTSDQIHRFMDSSVIMQWDNIRKSLLILITGGVYYFIWVIWLLVSYLHPDLQHWINDEYFFSFFIFFIVATLIYFALTYTTYHYREQPWVQRYMPYVAVAYLGCSLLFAGYSIGISSPATIAGYINLVTVGLVLHERKIIYPTFIPITALLLFTIMMCAYGYFAYAPIFSEELNQLTLYQNEYWVMSMMVLYVPIFIAGIGLFEVLLTQWRNRETLINHISRKDPLTGINNRRTLGTHLAQLEELQLDYAVVLLDLDFFKKINDQYGHEAGDIVLMTVAQILYEQVECRDECCDSIFHAFKHDLETLKQEVSTSEPNQNQLHKKTDQQFKINQGSSAGQQCPHSLVGRYGGEEFMLLFVQQPLQYVLKTTERCRQIIAQTPITTEDGVKFSISASFGVAFSQSGVKKEDIIRQADEALYQAKHQGRNQVLCYHSQIELFEQRV